MKNRRAALVAVIVALWAWPADAGPLARFRWGAADGVATINMKPHGAICYEWSGGETGRMEVHQRKISDLDEMGIGRRYELWEREDRLVHWEAVGKTSITPRSVDPDTCEPLGESAGFRPIHPCRYLCGQPVSQRLVQIRRGPQRCSDNTSGHHPL